MVRLSNKLIGALNLAILLLSLPVLGGGIYLKARAATECEKFLEAPLIALGVFLFVVSLAGFIGACYRNSCFLWLYLVVMFLLILLLFCFTAFAFVVTNKGAGRAVSDRGFKEYRLGDFSHWLQKRVEDSKNWRRIRSCLEQRKACRSMDQKNETRAQFVGDDLSPVQVPASQNLVLFAPPISKSRLVHSADIKISSFCSVLELTLLSRGAANRRPHATSRS